MVAREAVLNDDVPCPGLGIDVGADAGLVSQGADDLGVLGIPRAAADCIGELRVKAIEGAKDDGVRDQVLDIAVPDFEAL